MSNIPNDELRAYVSVLFKKSTIERADENYLREELNRITAKTVV
jgi:hypothetical protein